MYQGLFSSSNMADAAGELPERAAIDKRYKWRVDHIFVDDAAWEAGLEQTSRTLGLFADFRNHLATSADILCNCLKLQDDIGAVFGRLYLYAGLSNDQDTSQGHYQDFRGRASSLMNRINEATAFIQPEILSIPPETLDSFIAENSGLAAYKHYLQDLLRSRDHILSPEQEELLALSGEMSQGAATIFSMFNNADIRFPTIDDEEGRPVELTKSRYQRFMESPNRSVRESAYHALYDTYSQWTNTLAATLATGVKRNIFYARARKYNSALEAALDGNNIPTVVYSNVIDSINQQLAPLHHYMELRKTTLQLKELKPWDLTVPLVADVDFKTPFGKAAAILREALAPLGEDYLAILDEAFGNGWIDVYENRGKRAGAYSWSTYGTHPFILMNYNDTLNHLFTLAHELGHALHSYLTNKNQPHHYSHYTIFVAEVASTLNEALLMRYLLDRYTGQERRYLLNEYMDQIRGTVYTQALFAELELTIHRHVESGGTLTADYLNEITGERYQRFFGPVFSMPETNRINWCRIPHFYYNFYVYQYVTGFSAATALSQKILAGDSTARDKYLAFLCSGNSDYSISLLQKAGVDITSPEPILATTTMLNNLVKDFEKNM